MRGILRSQPSDGRRPRLRHPRARLFQRRLSGSERQTQRDAVQPPALAGRPSPAAEPELGARTGLPGDLDYAARRVRAAGGPNDQASYACECGYLFAAPVSTSVCCPHCGCQQAW